MIFNFIIQYVLTSKNRSQKIAASFPHIACMHLSENGCDIFEQIIIHLRFSIFQTSYRVVVELICLFVWAGFKFHQVFIIHTENTDAQLRMRNSIDDAHLRKQSLNSSSFSLFARAYIYPELMNQA